MQKRLWLVGVVAVLAGCSSEPTPEPIPSPCGDASFHDVTFRNGPGDVLQGYVAGAGPVGVVLGNESGKLKCSWKPFVHTLTGAGYRVLAFDNAEDTGGQGTVGDDMKAAVEYLRMTGPPRVILIGASRGATAALAVAALIDPPVTAVVSLSAMTTYRDVDALSAAAKLHVPVTYFASVGDAQSKADLYTLSNATGAGFAIVAGSARGQDIVLGPTANESTNPSILEFLAQYSKETPSPTATAWPPSRTTTPTAS